ncbi:penicillin acylase family protein [Methylocystis heyeri]|uniref:Penicillin acylase family protein n=1 Tax=Methylocystis heyeri TaxID=391905 RepID=A0A6B8KJC5_9HYPH|nr:penicillin acylase family protein [Methylocystis heyeri]QGM46678.1 penicillin acylase family protein [Methylocystis heyeri]
MRPICPQPPFWNRAAPRRLGWFLLAATALPVLSAGAVLGLLRLSLPDLDRGLDFVELSAPVEIAFDARATPHIHAANRDDAFAALGFVTAGDRLFQMDLLRRRAAGRLAEIFGEKTVASDRRSRVLGLEGVAREALARLPGPQRSTLASYAAGVNRAIAGMRAWPFEFYVLGYRPEPWRAEDSLLVLLGLEDLISDGEAQERNATIMRRALPPKVVAFLTPEADCFNQRLAPRDPEYCAEGAAPVEDLAPLFRSRDKRVEGGAAARENRAPASNAFAVSGKKTRDGRAILANDMHLALSVPNIWYRAELEYGGARLAGLTLPGLPLMLAGENAKVAWGLTNLRADVADLVVLSGEANRTDEYRTPAGFRAYGARTETIQVRGASSEILTVEETLWGPVAPERLLGEKVALHSALLDPATTDLALLDMDAAPSVGEAAALFRRAGGPPLNVVLADDHGDVAWTVMGHLPLRVGTSGLFSESWADGTRGWRGYLSPDDLPRRVDPPSGFIVSTNQRMLGAAEFKAVIGHEYQGGFRAWRAAEELSRADYVSEKDLLALQLDTTSSYYAYYRDLALKALAGETSDAADDEIASIRRYIEAWDGRAETESLGLPLLEEFRVELRQSVLAPVVARCRETDPDFSLEWSLLDDPVRRIIETGRPELIPEADYVDWGSFLRAALLRSARRLKAQQGGADLDRLTWGRVNRVAMGHVLSPIAPFLNLLLDMSPQPLPGCGFCLRVSEDTHAANARMIVAPGHEGDAIMQFAGGQSGQPGSAHYGDEQDDWLFGRPTPFMSQEARHKAILRPRR